MYMPLCRDCHARESRLNSQNHFEGNPELVDLKAESEAKSKRLPVEEANHKLQDEQRQEEDPKSFSTADLDESSLSSSEIVSE